MEDLERNLSTTPTAIVLPTKAMQKVVTAVATKVTQLIVSSHNKEMGEEPVAHSSYSHLVSCAEHTKSAIVDLIKATKSTVEEHYADDEGVTDEVETALQNMQIAADNLLLCCQILASTGGCQQDGETFYQPSDIISCTSKAFQCVVILLLCVDNAAVRKIICLANQAKEALTNLTAADSLSSLVDLFSLLAEAARVFFHAANQRRLELLSSKFQEKLFLALAALKHSMPMLATACSMAIKYPHNDEAVSSKLFALQQVDKAINDIVAIIKSQPDTVGDGSARVLGDFVLHARQIDDMLSLGGRYQMDKLELETAVQSLVQRVMTFVAFAHENSPPTSRKADALIKECRKLIELSCVVARLSRTARRSSLDELASSADDSSEFGSICRVARGKLKNLSKMTTTAVIALLTDVFTVSSEPAEDLVRIGEQRRRSPRDKLISHKFESRFKAFKAHCDRATESARFASMCCDDPDTLAQMRLCLGQFENLSRQMCDCAREGSDRDLDQLRKEWDAALRDLLNFCASSVGLHQMTEFIEAEIVRDFQRCHEDIVNLDESQLAKHLIAATGRAKLLTLITNQAVASHTDPLFRNGVLAHVRQLEDATAHVVASGNLLIEDTARLSSQESFLSAASSLRNHVSDVRLALQSRTNHPELASEERKGLRIFSDQGIICGMIKEMHVLNQKLASLGYEPNVPPMSFYDEPDKCENKVQERPVDETTDIDQLLATSGRGIELTATVRHSPKTATFGSGLHPVATNLLRALERSSEDDSVSACFEQLKRVNELINDVVNDADHHLRASRALVENVDKSPRFVDAQNAPESCITISKATSLWLKTLNESFSIIEGCVTKQRDGGIEPRSSVCESWSCSLRILMALCLKALQPHTICFRKFLEIPESEEGVKTCDQSNPVLSPGKEQNQGSKILSSKSQDVLSVVARSSDTLVILLRDVIMLSRRDHSRRRHNSQHGDSRAKSPHSGLLEAMNRVLDESKVMGRSIADSRRAVNDLNGKVATGKAAAMDISWLHLHALACSAKLGALSNNVDKVAHMVLGVRKLTLPLDWLFEPRDDCRPHTVKEYKRRVRTLALSTIEKAGKVLQDSTLSILELAKMNKVNHRIEVTCASMEKIIDFLLSQTSSESIIDRHGHVIDHLTFLHQSFMLEVARMSLVVKELTVCSRMTSTRLSSERESLPPPLHEDLAATQPSIGCMQGKSFEERLFELTKERKQREMELMELLSDIGDPVGEPK